jgi:alkylated DNA nucleotide flippase Atl1
LRSGERPGVPAGELGHIPRISRLMALAIHFEVLVHRGEVRDYADLARLGGVTRARVSQIMGLLDLAPAIQEDILFLPRVIRGRDPVTERQLRPIAAAPDWPKQRAMWRDLTGGSRG